MRTLPRKALWAPKKRTEASWSGQSTSKPTLVQFVWSTDVIWTKAVQTTKDGINSLISAPALFSNAVLTHASVLSLHELWISNYSPKLCFKTSLRHIPSHYKILKYNSLFLLSKRGCVWRVFHSAKTTIKTFNLILVFYIVPLVVP